MAKTRQNARYSMRGFAGGERTARRRHKTLVKNFRQKSLTNWKACSNMSIMNSTHGAAREERKENDMRATIKREYRRMRGAEKREAARYRGY